MLEYGNRMRPLPAPPQIVWDDLVAPRAGGSRPWLRFLADEVAPRVLESERPSRVVWSSLWPSRPDDLIVMDLAPLEQGTALRFRLLTDGEAPDASKTGHLRKRVNHLLYADLRYTYGQ